jgi:ribosome biogenesis GTPase
VNAEQTGIVIAVRPRRVQVHSPAGLLICALRKGLLRGPRREQARVVVGDRVRVELAAPDQGVIAAVLPRRTQIKRLISARPYREQVVAANVDRFLAMHSIGRPRFNARALDRLLVLGEAGGVASGVCINKSDLAAGGGEIEPLAEPYRRAGYPVFVISALRGKGIAGLRTFLAGRLTLLMGPSGVGKSTLLNAILPGTELPTAAVSAATGRGVHTTTRVDYLELPGGGAVLDTPGIRTIQPATAAADLADLFPEMRPHLGACRFRDCLHRKEPGCALRAAVEGGTITAQRYESYLRILEGLLGEAPLLEEF